MKLHCYRCKRTPEQIEEYAQEAGYHGMAPDEYCRREEGTLNDEGRFCCTSCYIVIGMPSTPTGWRAP